jgi:GNAT superfamily N-acetyltransferase
VAGVHRTSEGALRWLTAPEHVDEHLREQLMVCWREVSNAGGAVGFPFPPVDAEQVRPAVDAMVHGLGRGTDRLLAAAVDGRLAGWLLLRTSASELTRHWGRVLRVQTALPHRGRGFGRRLMAEVARSARDDLGLEQLHLELRAGEGLEGFYGSLGWHEVGRWPGALRLSEHDRRDEVLMLLPLTGS